MFGLQRLYELTFSMSSGENYRFFESDNRSILGRIDFATYTSLMPPKTKKMRYV